MNIKFNPRHAKLPTLKYSRSNIELLKLKSML